MEEKILHLGTYKLKGSLGLDFGFAWLALAKTGKIKIEDLIKVECINEKLIEVQDECRG